MTFMYSYLPWLGIIPLTIWFTLQLKQYGLFNYVKKFIVSEIWFTLKWDHIMHFVHFIKMDIHVPRSIITCDRKSLFTCNLLLSCLWLDLLCNKHKFIVLVLLLELMPWVSNSCASKPPSCVLYTWYLGLLLLK